MRRLASILACLALTGLLAAWIHSSRPDKKAANDISDSDKQRIREFWILNREANRLRLEGNFEAAIDLYRECLQIEPGHEDSLYYLGLSLEAIGEATEAVSFYQRMTERNPTSNRAFAQLGQVLSTPAPGVELDFSAAERAFLRCVELNREHSGPYLNLGRLKLNQGRLAEALDHFQTAAQFGSPQANLLAGYTCYLLGRKRQSAEFLQQVLDWYTQELKITGLGAVLEGDLFSGHENRASPQQNLALQAAVLRFWLDPASFPKFAGLMRGGATEVQHGAVWKDVGMEYGLSEVVGRAAWSDFDGDGRVDVVTSNVDGVLRLYRNSGRELVDVTQTTGLGGVDRFWGAAWGDYDLDGKLDLYVIRSGFSTQGENHLYRNNGDGTFSDMTRESGLAGVRFTLRARFLDLDRDDRPELVEAGAASGGLGPLRVFGYEEKRWSDQSTRWGLKTSGAVVDFAAADFDLDGATDLFLYRWGRPAVLLRNVGGQFEDVTAAVGLGNIRGAGYSSIFFDYDRDRFPDLLLTTHAPLPDVLRDWFVQDSHPSQKSLRLFHNEGGRRFEEVSQAVGLTRSFGTVEARPADLDGDGWTDLVLANGGLDALRLEPSVILRNLDGNAFELSGILPGVVDPSNAVSVDTPDLDGDGRPEIYLGPHPAVSSTSPARIFAGWWSRQ
jgi:tetratricopeptide (TPR) repeat protein